MMTSIPFNPTFTITKISTQSKDYVSNNDKDKNGVVDFAEFQQAGGLTGQVKSNLSPENLKAVYMSFAGSDGLDDRDYGQAILYIDSIKGKDDAGYGDGKITQEESDAFYKEISEIAQPELYDKKAQPDLEFGNALNYSRITNFGSDLGLDAVLQLGTAQKKDLAHLEELKAASDAETVNTVSNSDTLLKALLPLVVSLLSSKEVQSNPAMAKLVITLLLSLI
ncbi:MAG: hypothetical protein HEQ32_09325 [Vampirovibrio sp.]